MTQIKRIPILIFTVVTIMLSSCVRDTIDLAKTSLNWTPLYSVPAAYGNINMKQFIGVLDSLAIIKAYPSDSLLYITYSNTLLSESASNVVPIPDTTFQSVFLGSDLPAMPADSLVFNSNTDYTLAFKNQSQIDSIFVKAGTLNFNIQSTFLHTGYILVTLPTLVTSTGIPLQEKIPITTQTGTFTANVPIDISGYLMVLQKIAGTPNELYATFKIVLDNNGGGALQPNQEIASSIQLQNMSFSAVTGYFGSQSVLNTTSSMVFNLFNSVTNSNLTFLNPEIVLYFKNSFGIPLQTNLSNTSGVNTKTMTMYPVTFSPSINPFSIRNPSMQNFITQLDTLTINSTNSNINSVISNNPQQFNFSVSALTNPAGFTHNYIRDTSNLNIQYQVQLPFLLSASQYERTDTIYFNLSNGLKDISIIQNLLVKCNFVNSIPFSLNVQVLFADSTKKNILDSLVSPSQQPLISCGQLNANGKVITPSTKTTEITYTNEQISKIQNTNWVIIRAIVTTSNNGAVPVEFFSYSGLNVTIGASVQFKITNTNQL